MLEMHELVKPAVVRDFTMPGWRPSAAECLDGPERAHTAFFSKHRFRDSSERASMVGLADSPDWVQSGQPPIPMSLAKRVLMWYSLQRVTYKQ